MSIKSKQLKMGIFEQYLFIWVSLSIIIGIGLGLLFPKIFKIIASFEYASVNIVIAIFIWAMIYPMMINVNIASIKDIFKQTKGTVITLIINWLIKPFTMAALGILFFEYIFTSIIDPQSAKEYIAGMILLGVAPCTAMVFVWSHLVKGDPNFTLAQVSLNDIIMIFAFAPISGMLLGVTDIIIPWKTLGLSVALYIIIPLFAGYFTRKKLNNSNNNQQITNFNSFIKPFSILALLSTVILLFGLNAETIIKKPFAILLISIPLLIQSYGIFILTYLLTYINRIPFNIAAPAALIGSSNFFELAVAVSISLFGMNSGAALATVVGVLVEVPVMLSLVAFANKTKPYFKSYS